MGKIRVWMENEYYCIQNHLAGSESIQKDHALKLLDGLSDIFLPVMVCEGENALLCKVKGLIPLNEYQERIIDKQLFIDLVVQMDMMIRIGEQHGFSINNLEMDYSRVYINPKSTKLYFICWPIDNPHTHNNIEQFFKEMAFRCIFNRSEDTGYVKEYIRFFNSRELFSLVNFEKMIMLLANDNEERDDNSSSYTIDGPKETYGETTALDPTFWTEWNLSKNRVASDETSVLDPSLLNFNIPAGPYKPEVKKDPPYLVRKKRGEKIVIGKSEFVIGIGKSADYLIVNNKTVSRKHASIITKGPRYFLVDHNSTNGTFINGNQIDGGREYEIYPEDVIKLSDEEFTFYC